MSVIASGGTLVFCSSVRCQHFLSHSEVSLHYLVLPFSAAGWRYSTTLPSAVPRRVFTFLQASADWDTFQLLVGFGDGNVWRGVHVLRLGQKSARNMYQMQTFPSGIYRGNFPFPTVASRLQVKLLSDLMVTQPMEVLDPITYLGPLHLPRRTCAPGHSKSPS